MRRSAVIAVFCGVLVATATASAGAPAHRPLVAVVGDNDGTEITDFLVPYGVLAASGAADVVAVAVHPGPLHLMPAALTLTTAETIASFEARHPGGADYVIVPAVHHATDPELLAWLRATTARGGTIVGICDGAWVLAAAGLLDGRAATAHWYSLASLAGRYPGTRWVRDRRWVRDGPVMTTTGVSASLPATLAVVAEIAGRRRARALARELGLSRWSRSHESRRYRLDRGYVATAAANWLAFWRWERIGVAVAPGVDEIALAFTADAWARTYRSSAVVVSADEGTVATRHGLVLHPEPATARERVVPVGAADRAPARALDAVLGAIAERYGAATADFVALQLEDPWVRRGAGGS